MEGNQMHDENHPSVPKDPDKLNLECESEKVGNMEGNQMHDENHPYVPKVPDKLNLECESEKVGNMEGNQMHDENHPSVPKDPDKLNLECESEKVGKMEGNEMHDEDHLSIPKQPDKLSLECESDKVGNMEGNQMNDENGLSIPKQPDKFSLKCESDKFGKMEGNEMHDEDHLSIPKQPDKFSLECESDKVGNMEGNQMHDENHPSIPKNPDKLNLECESEKVGNMEGNQMNDENHLSIPKQPDKLSLECESDKVGKMEGNQMHDENHLSIPKHPDKLSLECESDKVDQDKDLSPAREVLDLSPVSQETATHLRQLVSDISSGKVKLTKTDGDKFVIVYPKRGRCRDVTTANMILSPKTKEDEKQLHEEFLANLEQIQHKVPPAGVVLDTTKISKSFRGYREGFEFEKTELPHDEHYAHNIFIAKDKKTGEEHVHKKIMISGLNLNEIRCGYDLTGTGYVPKLYAYYIANNCVEICMEYLKEAKTMTSIIDNDVMKFYQFPNGQKLIRLLSLIVLDGALAAVSAMYDKGWIHNDLHGGNVMIEKKGLKIIVLDFGQARRLKTPDGGIDRKYFKKDIANVMRLFTGMYTFQMFKDETDIRDNYEDELREAMATEPASLLFEKDNDKEELLSLVGDALKIETPEEISSLRSIVRKKLDQEMAKDNTLMERISTILFPEAFEDVHPQKI